MNPWKQRTKLFQRIGAMFEDHPMPALTTGQEFLNYMAKLKNLNDPKQAILKAAKLFDVDTFWNRPIRGYSSGMRRKLALAHAFLGEPELLILDEPTVTLDQSARNQLKDLIKKGLENKKTFIVAAHIIAESEELATHTAFFTEGKIQVQGKIQELAEKYGASRITIETKNHIQTAKTLMDAGYNNITITQQGLELAVPPGEKEKVDKILQQNQPEAKITKTWIDLWTIYKHALKKTPN